jgi:FkbM family methyltransferase
MQEIIDTIFGRYAAESKPRLDLTFDYETSAIRSFRDIAGLIAATTVVDVGANIGVYSVYLSDLPEVRRIYAFEPAPAAFALLRRNIALQANAAKIAPFAVALSDEPGQVKFNLVSPMSGANAVVSDATEPSASVITIDAARLDDMVPVSGEVVAVKIDVEGHEAATLVGSERFLRSNRCYVQIEILTPEIFGAVVEFMKNVGYEHLFSLQNDHLFIHRDWQDRSRYLLGVIAGHLARDLHDLTELRVQKRGIATVARKLWQLADYPKDPLAP